MHAAEVHIGPRWRRQRHPARLGKADIRWHPGVIAVMQPLRGLRLGPALQVIAGCLQRRSEHGILTRQRLQPGHGAGGNGAKAAGRQGKIKPDNPVGRDIGHAMIRHQHDVGGHPACLQARNKIANARIDFGHGACRFRRIGAEFMAIMVNRIEVKSQETGALRLIDPGQYLCHPCGVGQFGIKRHPLRRPDAVDRRFGTRPEHRRGFYAGVFGRHPDRLRFVPPAPVRHRRAIRQCKLHLGKARVFDIIVDDAVMVGSLAGDKSVVIGKGQRWKAWPHRLGVHAAGGQRIDVGGGAAREIIRSQAIDRNQNHRRS